MRDRAERAERFFEIPILVAALLVIPTIVIEQAGWGNPWKTIASVLNWTIWSAFTLELVTLLAVVPNRRRWLRRHPLELAIVVLTPPFLPSSLQAARLFRLLRVIRLLRLMKIVRRLYAPEGLRDAAVLAVMIALGGGAAFAAAENRSTWDGVYWAVTTMTTVGYGDLSPHTELGKGIAVVVMLVGIGFLTLVIGAIAQQFVTTAAEDVLEVEEESVAAVVLELRAVTSRLQTLETRVQRLAQRSDPPGG
jgi:voltage-gated potassium channel